MNLLSVLSRRSERSREHGEMRDRELFSHSRFRLHFTQSLSWLAIRWLTTLAKLPLIFRRLIAPSQHFPDISNNNLPTLSSTNHHPLLNLNTPSLSDSLSASRTLSHFWLARDRVKWRDAEVIPRLSFHTAPQRASNLTPIPFSWESHLRYLRFGRPFYFHPTGTWPIRKMTPSGVCVSKIARRSLASACYLGGQSERETRTNWETNRECWQRRLAAVQCDTPMLTLQGELGSLCSCFRQIARRQGSSGF